MSDLYRTLLISRPQVVSSGGSGLLTQANNLSDVSDVATARTNLGVTSSADLQGYLSTRSPSSFLYSDGATAGRGAIYQGSDRTLLTSAPAFEFVADVLFPATTASENRGIITVSSTGVNPTTGGFSFIAYASHLFFNLGITGGQWQASNYASNNAGRRKRFHVIIPCGTQNAPTVTDETGATVTFTQSVAPSGSDAWLGSTLANRAYIVGANWPAGETPSVVPILGTLTSAERDAWFTTGRPPAWVQFGGSAVNATGDASLTNDAAWQDSGGSFSVSAGQIVGTSVAQYGYIAAQASSGARILTAGSRVRWKVVVSAISGGNNFVLQQGANGAFIQSITAATTYTGTYTATQNDVTTLAFAIKNLSATASGITITSIEWFVDGALSLPSVQSINVVEDLTALGGNQARLLGNTPILLDSVPVSVIERPAELYTTTSIQLLGGAISGARKRRIVSVTGNSSASVNLSLGTSTGGTQLINAQAVNGDFDISTFASRFVAAGSSLWLTFSGSTTASIHIHLTDL